MFGHPRILGSGKPETQAAALERSGTPTYKVGDIQGDLASRRGRPSGQDMLPGNLTVIKAVVPLAELSDYNSRLSSVTGGEGSYTMEFSHYEVVPSNVQQQIIDAAKKAKAE